MMVNTLIEIVAVIVEINILSFNLIIYSFNICLAESVLVGVYLSIDTEIGAGSYFGDIILVIEILGEGYSLDRIRTGSIELDCFCASYAVVSSVDDLGYSFVRIKSLYIGDFYRDRIGSCRIVSVMSCGKTYNKRLCDVRYCYRV